ncbi:MAG TPA: universal stress protein [Burkholderiaceae bacterium]
MNYRSLLVLLDQSASCAVRLQLAMRLARERDCHLVGLAPTGLLDIPPDSGAATSLADYAARAWDALREHAERAAQNFRDECHAAGVKSFETVVDEANKAASLVRHAHCSDLVVLTQAPPEGTDQRSAHALVEQVVLHSARPTLVIPHAGRFERVGTKVLVAWDDTREAARALSDALPILCHSSHVQLVQWTPIGANGNDALHARLDAVQRWLMWHGVASDVCIEATGLDIADAMLSRATDIGADLIVMGAYGHARWAQRVLGGATRGMLASMTVPVLMSH